MSGLLAGRVAIVSGIGPGAGRSIALACAREGADVVLAARTVGALEQVAAEVREHGRRALAVPTDVTRPEDCRRLADAAEAELGRIDVLVNNAFRSAPYEPVEEASMDDWRQIFDVNLFGSVQLSQAVVPQMKARRSGAIVMVNSMSVRSEFITGRNTRSIGNLASDSLACCRLSAACRTCVGAARGSPGFLGARYSGNIASVM